MLCEHRRMFAAGVRFYAQAFAVHPRLATDLQEQHRYNAACFAARAAGQGKDADKLIDSERLALRRQALTWLRAELALWTRRVASGDVGRSRMKRAVEHWQKDPDLVGIRDKAALDRLSEEERAVCEKLWADVAALLKKSEKSKQEDRR
jgi:hypothetical protein